MQIWAYFMYVTSFMWQELQLSFVESEDGLDYIQDASEWDTVFVLENFEGPVFHKLHKGEAWIVGPPVIFQCVRDKKVCTEFTNCILGIKCPLYFILFEVLNHPSKSRNYKS